MSKELKDSVNMVLSLEMKIAFAENALMIGVGVKMRFDLTPLFPMINVTDDVWYIFISGTAKLWNQKTVLNKKSCLT